MHHRVTCYTVYLGCSWHIPLPSRHPTSGSHPKAECHHGWSWQVSDLSINTHRLILGTWSPKSSLTTTAEGSLHICLIFTGEGTGTPPSDMAAGPDLMSDQVYMCGHVRESRTGTGVSQCCRRATRPGQRGGEGPARDPGAGSSEHVPALETVASGDLSHLNRRQNISVAGSEPGQWPIRGGAQLMSRFSIRADGAALRRPVLGCLDTVQISTSQRAHGRDVGSRWGYEAALRMELP